VADRWNKAGNAVIADDGVLGVIHPAYHPGTVPT
jgi:hypothetical protein